MAFPLQGNETVRVAILPPESRFSGAAGNNIFLSKDNFDRVYLSKRRSVSEKRMSLFSQGGDTQV
jgi:hypothetical protein